MYKNMMYVQTPTQPVTGMFRLNEQNDIDVYDGTAWVPLTTHNSDNIMKPKLVCSEMTFGSLTFYLVEPVNHDWDEVYIWTRETFGPPQDGRRVAETYQNKWFISGGTFHFHDAKHRDWFVLKWSS